jgi:hypothetical protein
MASGKFTTGLRSLSDSTGQPNIKCAADQWARSFPDYHDNIEGAGSLAHRIQRAACDSHAGPKPAAADEGAARNPLAIPVTATVATRLCPCHSLAPLEGAA